MECSRKQTSKIRAFLAYFKTKTDRDFKCHVYKGELIALFPRNSPAGEFDSEEDLPSLRDEFSCMKFIVGKEIADPLEVQMWDFPAVDPKYYVATFPHFPHLLTFVEVDKRPSNAAGTRTLAMTAQFKLSSVLLHNEALMNEPALLVPHCSDEVREWWQ